MYQGLAKASPMVAFSVLLLQNATIVYGGKKMRCSSLQANSREYHPLPLLKKFRFYCIISLVL